MSTSSIYTDAQAGKLTEARLKKYLEEGEDLNGQNTAVRHTPLMAAVLSGRHKVLKLLIEHGADTHAVSAAGQTALWLAASKTNKRRREIVQLLLGAPQAQPEDLDKAPAGGDGDTPVMEAVQRGDDAVVRLLVDAGADLTLANAQGKQAKDLAREKGDESMLISLMPAAERHKPRASLISRIGAFLNQVIAWVNIGTLISGILKTIFGLAGRRTSSTDSEPSAPAESPVSSEPPAPSGPGDCKSVDDFKRYAEDSGLDRFFPTDKPQFLQRLVDGIAAFKGNPSPLNTPESLEGLVKLSLFQPIIFCDDSSSMKGPTSAASKVSRIEALREVVERITRICTLLVPDDDGTLVRFINQNVTWGPLNTEQIRDKMRDVVPRGRTDIGTGLRKKVLQPFVHDQLDARENEGLSACLNRPCLICVITDGCPTDGTAFVESMQACIDRLNDLEFGRRLVSFVVCQVGTDSSATEFLRSLAALQQKFGESVYVCLDPIDERFSALNKNNDDLEIHLFDILTTPLMR